jgi:hypothetical protein
MAMKIKEEADLYQILKETDADGQEYLSDEEAAEFERWLGVK